MARYSKVPPGVKLAIGFGLVLCLLLGLSLATYRTMASSDEASTRVARTLRVITLANSALGALGDIQLGTLGMQLSGRDEFQDSLASGTRAYADSMHALEALTTGDTSTPLAGEDRQAQAQRRTGQSNIDRSAWQAIPDPSTGQFDTIRADLNAGIALEQALLQQRTAAATDDRQFLRIALAGTTVIALVLAAYAGLFLRRDFRMAARLQATIQQREADLRARRALEALDRQKDEFLAEVSHDLRNPLAAIKGIAQILRRQLTRTGGIDPGSLLDRVTGIDVAANSMAAQLDELLDLTRLQMGRTLKLQREPVDLVALARLAVVTQQQATERHTLVLETDRDELTIPADRLRIERVIMNLLNNAVKYSPLGGAIVVHLHREMRGDAQWAVLDVSDPGVGIPADDVPRLFGSFYRAANVADRIPGIGLGLAAVRQFVEAHHGRVEVESCEGHGSTFSVWLPAAA